MRIWQPSVHRPHWDFDCEGSKEAEPQPFLQAGRKDMGQGDLDVGGSGLEVDRYYGEQHPHSAEKGIKKEFEGRVDPIWSAPHADDQEHRNQHALEEHVEENEIEGAE